MQMVLLVTFKPEERKEVSNEQKLQGRLRLFSTLLSKPATECMPGKLAVIVAGVVTLFTKKTKK